MILYSAYFLPCIFAAISCCLSDDFDPQNFSFQGVSVFNNWIVLKNLSVFPYQFIMYIIHTIMHELALMS